MGFLDFFTFTEKKEFINTIHQKLSEQLPELDENRLIVLACISGLLARVAYVDFQVSTKEKDKIDHALTHWLKLPNTQAQSVTKLAIDEMKQLSGLDVRVYCTPLNELLDIDQRYHIIELLFELAASDGEVGNDEINEISYIANALVLEKKYFLAAQAKVKEYLSSLK